VASHLDQAGAFLLVPVEELAEAVGREPPVQEDREEVALLLDLVGAVREVLEELEHVHRGDDVERVAPEGVVGQAFQARRGAADQAVFSTQDVGDSLHHGLPRLAGPNP
jgi:hypothetical protein